MSSPPAGSTCWRPSAWLLRADPLPHSWDVTSDSIAAWVAHALRVRRLMLVKHTDGFIGPDRGPRSIPPHVRRIALDAFSGVVDPYFARALDPATGCWLVRRLGPADRGAGSSRSRRVGAPALPGLASQSATGSRQRTTGPPEIPIGRAQRETMLDRERRQVRIRDQGWPASRARRAVMRARHDTGRWAAESRLRRRRAKPDVDVMKSSAQSSEARVVILSGSPRSADRVATRAQARVEGAVVGVRLLRVRCRHRR